MGIVNASPDSFSDPARPGLEGLVERGLELAADGATLIDVGGESGRTDTEAIPEQEEAARVAPVIERLATEGLLVSIDTWRAPVARAGLAAGAAMVNDVSGLSDPGVADACAETGAALVITHTRIPPKFKGFPAYADVVEDVLTLLGERSGEARRRGVKYEQIVFDPGIDLAKTPAQSVEVLSRLVELRELRRPLLVAVSRKDFIGALTDRGPRDRLAGTLAALAAAVDGGAAILRTHDIEAARDYLKVRSALRRDSLVPDDLRLGVALQREPQARDS